MGCDDADISHELQMMREATLSVLETIRADRAKITQEIGEADERAKKPMIGQNDAKPKFGP